ILVNDIWGGDDLTEWGTPFWKLSVEKGRQMLNQAVHAHIITSRYGVPLMIERKAGLIVEITDGDHIGYRSNLFYDLSKLAAIRLAYAMAADLRDYPGITAVAVTPGYLRSEAMLDRYGVTEANWRDAVKNEPYFAESETPCYVGRAVAALAADPDVHVKNGQVVASWTLMREYGFRDNDGRQPDWGAYFDGVVAGILERGPAAAMEEFILQARYYQVHLDSTRSDEAARVAAAIARTKSQPAG